MIELGLRQKIVTGNKIKHHLTIQHVKHKHIQGILQCGEQARWPPRHCRSGAGATSACFLQAITTAIIIS